jgi:hypothetical protein
MTQENTTVVTVPKPQISILNESTVITDQQAQSAMAALQEQVSRDFRPAWGIDAQLAFVPKGQTPPAGSWWLTILDNTDQADALGYHDLTNDGQPLGKVFAATDLQGGYQWTVTASHELLEMLADPYINLSAIQEPGRDGGMMTLYAYEVCDACEGDSDGYEINGLLLSDFVYPTWFEGFWGPGSTQFDYKNLIESPFQLRPGGYISVFDVDSGRGWSQLTAEEGPMRYGARPHVGSRRERRRTTRACWMKSGARQPARRRMTARVVFES